MKDESTHQPILFEAIRQTTGAILELGAGYSSTEQIHLLAEGRKILTVDDNQGIVTGKQIGRAHV